MKKISVLFYLLFVLKLITWAQMINNITGNAFTETPFFAQELIFKNKIKSIEGNVSQKKDGDIIRPTSNIFIYKFDSLGRLESIFETRTEAGKKDSTLNFYSYDSLSRLIMHRKTEFGGISTYHYSLDSSGRILKTVQTRDILYKNGSIKQSYLVNQEQTSFQKNHLGCKSIVFNSYNLPFKEEWDSINSDGYLLEHLEYFKMTDLLKRKKFFYNSRGLLAQISILENNGSIPIEEFIFQYDTFGNLIEKHSFKKSILIKDLQIIYDSKTQLLGSIIQREVSSNMMHIVRFLNYKFY